MADPPNGLRLFNFNECILGDKLKLWNKLAYSYYFQSSFGEVTDDWLQVVPPSNGFGYPKEEPAPQHYHNLQHPENPILVTIDEAYTTPALMPVVDTFGKPVNLTVNTEHISPGLRALMRLMDGELKPIKVGDAVKSREYWVFLGTEFV